MKPISFSLVFLFSFFSMSFLSGETSSRSALPTETATTKLEYPDNINESFGEVDEFYNKLDKNIYVEYDNAAFSMRKKINFKEVAAVLNTFKVKTRDDRGGTENAESPDIHPDRQVYFLGSFKQDADEEWHKYAIIDAETKTVLLSGNSYHKYENPFK